MVYNYKRFVIIWAGCDKIHILLCNSNHCEFLLCSVSCFILKAVVLFYFLCFPSLEIALMCFTYCVTCPSLVLVTWCI